MPVDPVRSSAAALLGACALLGRVEIARSETTIRLIERPASACGIDFVHVCGSREKDWISEVNGSGVALLDFDRDGDLDVYLVSGRRTRPEPATGTEAHGEPPRNRLYRNDGGWRFADVTAAAGVGDAGFGCSAGVADVNDDGWLDLYVTNWGPNALFLGGEGGTFRRVRSGAEDPAMSCGACFADFDRDGALDLYVVNYLELDPRAVPEKKRGTPSCVYKGERIFCGPGGLPAAPDRLYLGRGDGTFEDVSERWGVSTVRPGYGLGALVVDVRRDGWPDVVVANDTSPNFLFVGSGERFDEAGLFLGIAYNDYGVAQGSMGLAAADLRGLGRDDVFIANYEDDTNTLWLAEADGSYVEGTYPAGLGEPSYRSLAWATVFADLDGDGDEDLFVSNGHVAPQADRMAGSIGYRQPNQVYENTGAGRFRLCSDRTSLIETVASSRGAAAGDLDGDGDPDIVVSNIDDVPHLLENRSSESQWLAFRLVGTRSNRAAIGARVVLVAGGRRQERVVRSGMSYASQCELAARFGLGRAGVSAVESVTVTWPSGLLEAFPPPDRAGVHELVEGRGAPARGELRAAPGGPRPSAGRSRSP